VEERQGWAKFAVHGQLSEVISLLSQAQVELEVCCPWPTVGGRQFAVPGPGRVRSLLSQAQVELEVCCPWPTVGGRQFAVPGPGTVRSLLSMANCRRSSVSCPRSR
jgi:hypothetical protein